MTVWMTARGAGLAALLLLSLSTGLGALVSRHGKPATRYLVQYLHRAAAGLGLTVLVLHIVTVLMDSYAGVGWRGAVLPFTAHYRPTWTGLGTLALYTFLGVSVLGLARGRMAASPRAARTWRALHGLAYAGWGLAMAHGFFSGSDSSVPWVRALYIASLIGVGAAIVHRIRHSALARRRDGLTRHDRFVRATRPVPARALARTAHSHATTRTQPALARSGATR